MMKSARFLSLLLALSLSLFGCTREVEEQSSRSESSSLSSQSGAKTEQKPSSGSESGEARESEPSSQSAFPEGDVLSDPVWESRLEEAMVQTVREREAGNYYPGEFQGVGCALFDALPMDDGSLAVFALVEYVEYGFVNGCFTNVSGFRNRIRVDYALKGDVLSPVLYEHMEISFQSDERLAELLAPLQQNGNYTYGDDLFTELRARTDSQAGDYLRQIGRRDARLVDQSEMIPTYLEEVGVSEEVMDRLRKDPRTTLYPDWIGTQERLEDGSRFVYQTDYDPQNNRVFYIKSLYGVEGPVESFTFDAETGEEE